MSFDRWMNDLADHVSGRKAAAEPERPACDVCEGTGYAWGMTCYGRGPSSYTMHCPDCSTGEPCDRDEMEAAYEDAGLEMPPSP